MKRRLAAAVSLLLILSMVTEPLPFFAADRACLFPSVRTNRLASEALGFSGAAPSYGISKEGLIHGLRLILGHEGGAPPARIRAYNLDQNTLRNENAGSPSSFNEFERAIESIRHALRETGAAKIDRVRDQEIAKILADPTPANINKVLQSRQVELKSGQAQQIAVAAAPFKFSAQEENPADARTAPLAASLNVSPAVWLVMGLHDTQENGQWAARQLMLAGEILSETHTLIVWLESICPGLPMTVRELQATWDTLEGPHVDVASELEKAGGSAFYQDLRATFELNQQKVRREGAVERDPGKDNFLAPIHEAVNILRGRSVDVILREELAPFQSYWKFLQWRHFIGSVSKSMREGNLLEAQRFLEECFTLLAQSVRLRDTALAREIAKSAPAIKGAQVVIRGGAHARSLGEELKRKSVSFELREPSAPSLNMALPEAQFLMEGSPAQGTPERRRLILIRLLYIEIGLHKEYLGIADICELSNILSLDSLNRWWAMVCALARRDMIGHETWNWLGQEPAIIEHPLWSKINRPSWLRGFGELRANSPFMVGIAALLIASPLSGLVLLGIWTVRKYKRNAISTRQNAVVSLVDRISKSARKAGLDQPTANRYWNYYIHLKRETGVPSHKKVTSLASGGVVSDVLYATNADQLVLVDQNDWAGDPIEGSLQLGLNNYQKHTPYRDGTHSRQAGLQNCFFHDLEKLGISKDTVQSMGEERGAYVYAFNWAYPGEKPVRRTVYLYPSTEVNLPTDTSRPGKTSAAEWHALGLRHLPVAARGSEILFQKASEDLVNVYPYYLPAYATIMAEEAWFLTDDLYPKPDSIAKELQTSPFGVRDIHTPNHPNSFLQALVKEMTSRHIAEIRGYPDSGYGWNLHVRRLLPGVHNFYKVEPPHDFLARLRAAA